MGNGGQLGRVHVEPVAQPLAGRVRHDHDLVRQGGNLVQDRSLMWRRMRQNRVGDHDGWDVEAAQDLEHLVPVSAAVQPVFMLHHRHVELVQHLRSSEKGAGRSVDQLADDTIVSRGLSWGIDDADDADLSVVHGHARCQGRAEGGETAGSRRIGTEDPERGSGATEAFGRQIHDGHRCSSGRLGRGVEPARGDVGRHGRPAQAKRLSQGDERVSLPRLLSAHSVDLARRRPRGPCDPTPSAAFCQASTSRSAAAARRSMFP